MTTTSHSVPHLLTVCDCSKEGLWESHRVIKLYGPLQENGKLVLFHCGERLSFPGLDWKPVHPCLVSRLPDAVLTLC